MTDRAVGTPTDPQQELRRIIDVIERNLNYRHGQRPVGWRDLIAFADRLAPAPDPVRGTPHPQKDDDKSTKI